MGLAHPLGDVAYWILIFAEYFPIFKVAVNDNTSITHSLVADPVYLRWICHCGSTPEIRDIADKEWNTEAGNKVVSCKLLVVRIRAELVPTNARSTEFRVDG